MKRKPKRQGVGQPAQYGEPMAVNRTLRLPADLVDKIQARADRLDKKWSWVARKAIEEGLRYVTSSQ